MKWQTVRIEDICDTGAGGTPSRSNADKYFGGNIAWVKSGELREQVISTTEETLTQAGLDESAAKIVPAGALLVALYGATVGRIATLGVDAATNQAVCHIVPRHDAVDHRFLFYALRTKVPNWLSRRVGGAQPNISQQIVRETEIPLPPLAEQRLIADILDRAEALRAKRRAALALLDTLPQAILLEMFGDPTMTRKVWGASPLADVVAEFRYGTSNKSQRCGKPALRIPNVVGGIIDLTELKLVPVDDAEFQRLRLNEGDVLFVRTNGNPEYVGRCAVFEGSRVRSTGFDATEFVYASYLIRARLLPKTVTPVFLREYMLSVQGRRELRSRCSTSAGQFNINTENLGTIPIPRPPVSLQSDFARRIGAVEKLKAAHQASLAKLDELFASLQHRAFRGEL